MAIKLKCYTDGGNSFPAFITGEQDGEYTWVEAIAGTPWIEKGESGREGSEAKDINGLVGLYNSLPFRVIMHQFVDEDGNNIFIFDKSESVTEIPNIPYAVYTALPSGEGVVPAWSPYRLEEDA